MMKGISNVLQNRSPTVRRVVEKPSEVDKPCEIALTTEGCDCAKTIT